MNPLETFIAQPDGFGVVRDMAFSPAQHEACDRIGDFLEGRDPSKPLTSEECRELNRLHEEFVNAAGS